MVTLKTMVAAIALSAISVVAYGAEKSGAEKSGKASTSFKTADSDGNGAISMDEARSVPGLAEKFAEADKNGDGQLSKSEYEAAVKGGKAKKSEQSKNY